MLLGDCLDTDNGLVQILNAGSIKILKLSSNYYF